jgi:xanthine dehydrogenase YagT iron-sulfur-binding subunit
VSRVNLGDRAPAFRLPLRNGTTLTLDAFAGEPIVIAFLQAREADGPPGSDPAQLERARAELRGLGAALLAFWAGGLWCFRPDDELQVLARPEELDVDLARELRATFGVPDDATGLFVLDAEGRVQLDVVGDQGFEALVDMLAAAGRALAARALPFTLTRRQLVLGSLIAAFAWGSLEGCHRAPPPASPPAPEPATPDVEVTLNVNGQPRRLRIDPRTTLLDALRERLGLTGSKKGCDQGQCGACTVLMDGRRVKSCLVLGVAADGPPIVTIEGLATGETLHPMQAAFIAEDGFQCGYCTSGQIMSAVGLLREPDTQQLSDDDVRERMSGNICRCGAYPNIVAAIQRVRQGSQGTKGG